MTEYEVIIGLEIHVELNTETKIFCGCKNDFGSEPNTNVCPVCLSMPGTLPVLNKKVVEYGVKAGYALNCDISNFSKMDRKNYVYPDLSKSYQISQYDFPLCKNGHLELDMGDYKRILGITRIHIEEDAGKLVHEGEKSFVDYNRGGVPLIEIVTEPDLRNANEVRSALEAIRANMGFIGVSDCKMEEGSMRCDINISVRPFGQETFNTRTEIKNINSISTAFLATEAEAERQIAVLRDGEEVVQETRRWDAAKGTTVPMRGKEEANDYRYFPDPDLVPIYLSDEELKQIKGSMHELPGDLKKRYMNEYGLSEYDAGIMVSSKEISDYFIKCIGHYDGIKTICNLIMGNLAALLHDEDKDFDSNPMSAENLCDAAKLIDSGTLNSSMAKEVFEESYRSGTPASEIAESRGLHQIDDTEMLRAILVDIINNNPKAADDYRNGNDKAKTFFVGQVMRATKGKANPKIINSMIEEELR